MTIPSSMMFNNFTGANIPQCISDVSMIYKDITGLISQFESDPNNVIVILPMVINTIKLVQSTLPDCGINFNIAPMTDNIFNAVLTSGCLNDL